MAADTWELWAQDAARSPRAMVSDWSSDESNLTST